MSIQELIPVLQTAISPMILISGVGLLLITMTNRLGRTIDRARELAASNTNGPAKAQLAILWQRARLLRAAIWLASFSALCGALLIFVLFLTALFGIDAPGLVGGLFMLCMVFLIGSLIAFVRDVNRSLTAIRLELEAGP